MLVDLDINDQPRMDPRTVEVLWIMNGGQAVSRTKRHAKGVYEISHHNFDLVFPDVIVDHYPFDPMPKPANGRSWDDTEDENGRTELGRAFDFVREQQAAFEAMGCPTSDYGVCDHPTQVVEKFPGIETINMPLVVSVCEVRREDQPDEGGWRWHKWGPYIGDQKTGGWEYLVDEENIESVWCFHIYGVKP